MIFFKQLPINEIAPPTRILQLRTTTQEFRQKTIDDIESLERRGHIYLAALEAEKLIKHLQKEFNI